MTKITSCYLTLPWYRGDTPQASGMSLQWTGDAPRRNIFKNLRLWYKAALGINVPKCVIEHIWNTRVETVPMSVQQLHELANSLEIPHEDEDKRHTESEVGDTGEAEA